MKETELRQIPLVALFSALGIVFPQVFHLFGLGAPFLPMFIPVMVGSMFLSFRYALLMAGLTPTISWLLTSMPPVAPPILPVVIIELLLIAFVIVLLRSFTHWSVIIIVLTVVVADRLLLFAITGIIAPLLAIEHPFFTIAVVAAGLPGILLQIVTVPYTVYLIERKYPQWKRE